MTANQFETPKAKVTDTALPENLAGYAPADIKKLYYRSCNINGIAFLIALGALVLAAMAFLSDQTLGPRLFLLALLVFYAFAIVGIVKRTSWGRILGIVVCTISLINIPLGTLIGILGLFAFIKSKELFGPNRLTHTDVKLAFKEFKGAGAF